MARFLIPNGGYTLRQQQEMVDKLIKIGAFNDSLASARLRSTGSYSSFDEPGSVSIARDILLNTLRIKLENLE